MLLTDMIDRRFLAAGSQHSAKGKAQRAKGKAQRLKGKGQRARQTTRQVSSMGLLDCMLMGNCVQYWTIVT